MTEQENKELMYASDEDIVFYLKCVEGLPTLAGLDGSGNGSDGIPLPYGLGAHSVRCLREIIKIVKPKAMLEIGFNMGWSASLWLSLSNKLKLVSCDISAKEETIMAAKFLQLKYNKRFFYYMRNNEWLPNLKNKFKYDLIFIDGGHLIKDVVADIELALELQIPHIGFDDFLEEFGEVQKAIQTFGNKLEQVNVNGNIALYKNKYTHE